MNLVEANRHAALMSLFYYGEQPHYGLIPPAALPTPLRVATPEQAIQWLETDGAPGGAFTLRLALAELAGASGVFGGTYADYVDRLGRTLMMDPGLITQLRGLPMAVSGNDELTRLRRFFTAYVLASGSACRVRNFGIRKSYRRHVSDVTTWIEVNRPVTDFEFGMDPRNWSQTLPNVWEESYEIDRSTLPIDRQQAVANVTKSSAPFMGRYLFEKADWSFMLNAPIAFWRTVLRIDLDRQLGIAAAVPYIRFDYKLYECLENSFFGTPRPGGIDVDHGHGECHAVTGDPSWTRLEAQKVVRFTQPRLEINDLAFVSLIIWFTSLILIAACAPAPSSNGGSDVH